MKKETMKKAKKVSDAAIRPLGDRVLIRELKEGEKIEKTASGIYIPDSVKEDKGAKRGEVVAVGPGRHENGKLIPVSVKVGEKVLYQWGDTAKVEDTEYVLVSESNIIGVIK